MATFSIEEFKSKVSKVGLARPTRFEMLIQLPKSLANYTETGRLVSMFCDVTNLPLINVTTKQHNIYGPAYQRPIATEYSGEGVVATFYVDREMTVKKFFDAWVFSIINPDSFNVSYQTEYISDITINQLDEQDNITYSVILEEAFPRSVEMLPLNNEAMNQVHRLNILFAFRKWRTTEKLSASEKTPIVQNPNSPFSTNSSTRFNLR